MIKERLEEIEKNLDPLGYGMGGHLISVNDINWLVGYAKEHVERVQKLEQRNKRYREALEKIARINIDQGTVTVSEVHAVLTARNALEG